MSTFNADAWLKSVEKPSITINGKTYTGKLLSYEEFLPFATRLEGMNSQDTKEDFTLFVIDFLSAIFPKPFFRPWVVPHILKLPNLVEVTTHFLALQAGAMRIPLVNPLKMNGTLPQEAQ